MAGELNVLRSNENHFILFILLLKFMVCLLDDLNKKSVERFKGFLFQKSPQITLTSLGKLTERTLCTYTGNGLSACRLLLLQPDVHKELAALSFSLSRCSSTLLPPTVASSLSRLQWSSGHPHRAQPELPQCACVCERASKSVWMHLCAEIIAHLHTFKARLHSCSRC